MNPLIAGLIGAAIMYVVSAIITIIDEYWLDDAYTAPISILFIIVATPVICVWKFFRNVAVPVQKERQENKFIKEMINSSVQIFPGIYFHHDKKAKAIANKFFLFRLEK